MVTDRVFFGINAPNFGEYGDPRTLAKLAQDAEAAGWDGFFVWDHLQYFDPREGVPVTDAWIALAAAAAATSRIRLGPMITPLARRRPWNVARESVSLDHLSGGRLILGVGLGEPAETDFAAFGEETHPRVRARKLDEGLTILAGLWSGAPFSFEGEHYRVRNARFLPTPLQTPRIPVWVGGSWPHRRPLRRAARWDGVFPIKRGGTEMVTPEDLVEIVSYVRAYRAGAEPFDVVLSGETPGDDPSQAAATVAPYVAAGLTWWLETLHGYRGPLEAMRDRIRRGPPQL